jgi:diaminopimelate decarboxylase
LTLDNVSCHIGSQILNPSSLLEAIDRVLALIERLRAGGIAITNVDLGGGLGVAYKPGDETPSIGEYVRHIVAKTEGRGLHVAIEPGRSLVAEGGVLLSRVLLDKENGEKLFVIIDAAMNDLMRPSLYKAHHEIEAVREPSAKAATRKADIVGPVCESGDFLAKDRVLPVLAPGDLVAIRNAGAYGFVMASNYNSRPRAAEVLIEGATWRVIRERESLADLVRGEKLL